MQRAGKAPAPRQCHDSEGAGSTGRQMHRRREEQRRPDWTSQAADARSRAGDRSESQSGRQKPPHYLGMEREEVAAATSEPAAGGDQLRSCPSRPPRVPPQTAPPIRNRFGRQRSGLGGNTAEKRGRSSDDDGALDASGASAPHHEEGSVGVSERSTDLPASHPPRGGICVYARTRRPRSGGGDKERKTCR